MRALSLLATLLGAAALPGAAQSQGDAPVSAVQDAVLAELFTSQSCSSCPPAEQFFNVLADTDGVVAIQWHVDYWDQLVHGRDGNWKDPFSSGANTERQRDYNLALRGAASVYTPQAVIGGVTEAVGSHAATVAGLIQSAPAQDVGIEVSTQADGYIVRVTPIGDTQSIEAEAILVTLLGHEDTDVRGGENAGLHMEARNIAVATDTLGAWRGDMETYRASLPAAGHTCAVIVQEKAQGRVLGAAYCPP